MTSTATQMIQEAPSGVTHRAVATLAPGSCGRCGLQIRFMNVMLCDACLALALGAECPRDRAD